MSKKKPDNIVYTEEDGYNASILPYGTNTSAPHISLEDISFWKGTGVNKVNKQFSAKFNQLKDEYKKLMETYEWNTLVYKASFNFEPVIGETYYLYYDSKGDIFLSLINPNEWNKECIGTFTLNSERVWLKK